jgi:hypothetical protein
MNKLNVATRGAIIRSLVAGNSVSTTARLTGISKGTVFKLLVEVGEFCLSFQDHFLRRLRCETIKADAIWSFGGAKGKSATNKLCDIWTYIGICADSKLVVSWLVGPRNPKTTRAFMCDLSTRVEGRIELPNGGLDRYLPAVENVIGSDSVDDASIVTTYVQPTDDMERQPRYSLPVVTGAIRIAITGNPDAGKASRRYLERSNRSTGMDMRHLIRRISAFSKKAENHAYAVSLNFMYYNYCRTQQTLTKTAKGIKTTPAMAAGLTNHVWNVEEILERMDANFFLQSS